MCILNIYVGKLDTKGIEINTMGNGRRSAVRIILGRVYKKHRWIRIVWALAHFPAHILQVIKRRLSYLVWQRKYAVQEGDDLSYFKDKFKGRRCFIIGNGPSLTLEDLELLKKEICFSFNAIVNLLHKTEWRPTFYVTGSPNLYGDKLEKYVSEIPYYLIFYNDVGNTSEYLRERDNVYFYRRNVFSSYEAILQSAGMYKDRYDMTKELGYSGTNAFCAINMAFYMGFKEIVLIGVDNIYGNEKYYFQNILNDKEQTNKGSNYIGNFDGKVYDEGWVYLERVSPKLGVKIINATRGGTLEAFERKKLEEVLAK